MGPVRDALLSRLALDELDSSGAARALLLDLKERLALVNAPRRPDGGVPGIIWTREAVKFALANTTPRGTLDALFKHWRVTGVPVVSRWDCFGVSSTEEADRVAAYVPPGVMRATARALLSGRRLHRLPTAGCRGLVLVDEKVLAADVSVVALPWEVRDSAYI